MESGNPWGWGQRMKQLHAVKRQHKLKIKESLKYRRSCYCHHVAARGCCCLSPDYLSRHSSISPECVTSLFTKKKRTKSANKIIPNHAGSSTSQNFPLHRITKAMTDTPRCWDPAQFIWIAPCCCYLVVTLKPKRFNSFYCSICIPDNQTGSWPWGPWRSCRAVPHTHGCSGGKPRGGLQS